MKVRVKTSEIGKGLKSCVNATEIKDDYRKCIQIEAENDTLKISASNSLYSFYYSCDAEVEEEGFAVVDGKTAYSVISKATDYCGFVTSGNRLIIKGCGKTTLSDTGRKIQPAGESEGKTITCDSVVFKNAVNTIRYAISEDQSRLILTGAHFVTDGQFATITSLDGFRLAQTSFPCNGDIIDVVIPAKTLSAVCEPIVSGTLEINTNGSRIAFTYDNCHFNSSLLSGNYIDTSKLIPTDFKSKTLAKTSDIKNMIESATIASGMTNLVSLSFSGDKMMFTSNSETAGFEGDIDAFNEGEDIDISFNLKYLSNTISHITTDQCIIRMNTNVSPAIITPYTEEYMSDIHLLLPVRKFTS